jgi:hypothetical protein
MAELRKKNRLGFHRTVKYERFFSFATEDYLFRFAELGIVSSQIWWMDES